MTYAAAFPMESVVSDAWLQSQVFIVAITSAPSVRLSSAFSSRSPSARLDRVEVADHFSARFASG
jgi:hypothetical protein